MLDLFLEATYQKTKQAEAAAAMNTALASLPVNELMAMTRGESPLNKVAHYGGDDAMCWLEHFQGTPLYEEALAIEKRQLELDMQRNADQQKSQGVYNEQDVLRVKRRSLELQLAEQAGGGDELQAVAPEGSPEGVAQTAAPAPSGEGAMNVAKVAATEITPEEAKAIRHHQIANHLHALPRWGLLGSGIGALYSLQHGGNGPAIGAGLGAGYGALLTHAANKKLDRHAQTAAAGKMPAENRRHSQRIVGNDYMLPISAGLGALGPGVVTNWNPAIMAGGAVTSAYRAHRRQASNKALLSIDQRARDKTAAMNVAKTSSDLTEAVRLKLKKYPEMASHSDVPEVKAKVASMRFQVALTKQGFAMPAGITGLASKAMTMANANPTAALGLAGAGLGAAGGAIAGGPGNRLGGALKGGVMGGAAGAATGFVAPRILGSRVELGAGDMIHAKAPPPPAMNMRTVRPGQAPRPGQVPPSNGRANITDLMPPVAPPTLGAANMYKFNSAMRFKLALMKQADAAHIGRLIEDSLQSAKKVIKPSALGGHTYEHIGNVAKKTTGALQAGALKMKSMAGHHPAVGGGGGAQVMGW